LRKGQRGCRVAGYDNQVRFVPIDCVGEHLGDTSHEFVLGQIAVRETSVIREVDKACVRTRDFRFAEYRKAAEP
jgi:hypothetical protein